ncbi:unnamed protein product [Phytomonas sp. EM1]|nr:unnamed protein product [Phytomonas sp. EM1]|eukprot:CCW63011.1 unnamed protein product [Phytomonas sp. isolate EM1]
MIQGRAISRATLDTPQSPILSTSEKPRNSIMGVSGTTSFSASALPQRKTTSRFKEKTLCREKNSDDVGSTKARGLMRKRSLQSATTRAPGTARSRDVTPTKRTSPPKPKFQKLYGGSSPREGRCATAGASRRPYSAAGIGAARPPQVNDRQLRKRKEDLRRELYAWNRALEQKEGDSDAV